MMETRMETKLNERWIPAFHAFQRLWNENAADGNNP
jgi:hypothetical protein